MNIKRVVPFLLSLFVLFTMLAPSATHAQEQERKVVRVGWYESPFNMTGKDGSRSGYAYEYQQKLVGYTGWKYEYVNGSWNDLLQMLIDGDIDLLTDVSYTEERAKNLLYSEFVMGTEYYYIYASKKHPSIIPYNLPSLNGMKIAVNKNSFQSMLLKKWMVEKGLSFDIIECNLGNLDDINRVLETKLDAFVFVDSGFVDNTIICTIGQSDFYFVTNKNRQELMNELNAALNIIHVEDGNYGQVLWEKYFGNANTGQVLSDSEIDWLNQHGPIRVGYRDNYMPFSGTDSKSKEATGMLRDYLDAATESFDHAKISFELVAFSSTMDAKKALRNGEIDCMFPVNLPMSEAEDEGLLLSNSIVDSQMDILVSSKNRTHLDLNEDFRFAVNQGNISYQTILNQNFKNYEIVSFPDTKSCFKGIADGKADGILASTHRLPVLSNLINQYKLVPAGPKTKNSYHFAMTSGNVHLFSILNKIQHMTSVAAIQGMILKNTTLNTKTTFIGFMRDNLFSAIFACLLIVIVLTYYLLKSKQAEKLAKLAENYAAKAYDELVESNTKLSEGQEKLREVTLEQEARIEEINKLNAELTKSKQEAEAANNAKTSFLFNMSHDIRTPMNAIMGFRDLLEKHQDEPKKRADFLKKIEDSSNVLLSIINNVLEMARIEKGTIEIDETAWSAEQFNDTLYSIFHSMMLQKGVTFTRKIEVMHPYVYCDPIKLREVFINILSNAYKYTNRGGHVNMHLKEVPSTREGYAFYQTTISDTGIGMSKEFLPHIFEEFAKENSSTDNKIEGTGLGMPIVKRLLDFMDGTIEVKSEKGVGSTFIVTIPHRIAEKSKLVDHAGIVVDPNLFNGKRILLAEDNDLNAEIAIEILGETGFIVERAEDGAICCEMLSNAGKNYYDLILMDIQMPNMNGYEATRTIRKMHDSSKAYIPIIAMTANAFEEDKREAFRAGMNAHVAKPINMKELMKALAGILG